MIRHFFKLALRNIKRSRTFLFINVSGLACGMACCILIFLFIQDELNFDKYHHKANRIYRIAMKNLNTGEMFGRMPGIMHSSLLIDFPEIETAARIYAPANRQLTHDDKQYREPYFPYADGSLFRIFDFTLESGDPEKALEDPFMLVITRKAARKYFGDEDPIGKTLMLDNEHMFVITGIMREIPYHSHFRFDMFASYSSLKKINEYAVSNWAWSGAYIYLLFPENTDIGSIESKLPEFIERHRGSAVAPHVHYELQPLGDIYLRSSSFQIDIGSHGDIAYIYGFSVIAFLVLLIACFNFINLSTARSYFRAKEIGIKKVLGAHSGILTRQFLSESLLFAVLSMILAWGIIELFMPMFNNLAGKNLRLNLLENWPLAIVVSGLIMVVSILAGYYPALLLSRLQPFKALRGLGIQPGLKLFSTERFQLRFSQGLVVFQFAISIALTICTILVYHQMDFFKNKKIGFIKDHTVVIENPFNDQMEQRYARFKNTILTNPQIESVTAAFNVPPHHVNYGTNVNLGEDPDEPINMDLVFVDYDFLEKIGGEFIAGRNFSIQYSTDETEAIILNETAAKALNLENPLGRTIVESHSEKPRKIIGVVKDVYYRSLHTEVRPMLFYLRPYFKTHNIVVKIKPENVPSTLAYLEKEWKKTAPDWIFQYSFLDQRLESLYNSEKKMGKVFYIFTLMGMFISCLGLFGMASFAVTRRIKEIGIRKVLGASVSGIAFLLSKEFTKWVIIANVISWPFAYYLMSNWLQNFHYRISVDLWIFLFSGILAYVIALLTVAAISIKAALANPADIIRYE